MSPVTLPSSSLHALLQGSVDYAGLFPPANLSLETAVRNYAVYRPGPDDWLLARFVCPSQLLEELRTYTDGLVDPATLRVSALGLPNSISGLQVEAIELALTANPAVKYRVAVSDVLGTSAEAIEKLGAATLTPFFEVTVKERWRHAVGIVLEAIAEHNRSWKGVHCGRVGFKLRTGGLTPEAVPSIEDVVFVISTCRQLGVAFKCTAGLHHPIRHYSRSLGAKMHGFLNVFVAAVLAHGHSLEQKDLTFVLEDEDAGSFQFDDGGLSWQGLHSGVDQIVAARQDLVTSFGSCSFEEPLEDLRKLQLL